MQKKNYLLILLAFMIYAMAYSEDPSSKCPIKDISQGVNLRDLVSQADLVYNKPVTRSEAGMPVGNGRMGICFPNDSAEMSNKNEILRLK